MPRRVLRIDAGFEWAVASALVLAAAAGGVLPLPGGWATPAGLAVILAGVGAWLWLAAPTAPRPLVLTVAGANAAGAAVLAAWLALALAAFTPGGSALVAATAACLLLLAVVELVALDVAVRKPIASGVRQE